MILKSIVDIFSALINNIAKLLATVLLMFYLWIPVLFCLGFVAVCAIAGINISDNTKYLYIGLVVSCLISGICIIKRGLGKNILAKKTLSNNQAPIAQPNSSIYNVQQLYSPLPLTQIPSQSIPQMPVVATHPINATNNIESYSTNMQPLPMHNSHLQTAQAMSLDNYNQNSQVKYPLIFASRRNPNIIVQEYSDRLIFYYKDGKNIYSIGTEFKDNQHESD